MIVGTISALISIVAILGLRLWTSLNLVIELETEIKYLLQEKNPNKETK